MEQAIKSSTSKLSVSQLKARNLLIRLVGVTKSLEDKQVEEAVFRQNGGLLLTVKTEDCSVKVVRRTNGRTPDICNVVLEVSPDLYRLLVDRKLRIGYQVVWALDQSPIVQCYRCMGYGHFVKECRSPDPGCGHCAGNHDSRQCPRKPDTPSCINCLKNGAGATSNHTSFSTTYPEWQKWDRIARDSVSYC